MTITKNPVTVFPKKPDDLVQPAQPSPLYEFLLLVDPPDDWVFLGVRFGGINENRTMKMTQMLVLMKHYFWGMHWEEIKQTAKTTRKVHSLKDLTRKLYKLFYYMQEIHRPKTWGDLLNLDRDTGPRLLRYDLNPRPPPLSRWFGTQPNDRTVILPAYVRPQGAPLDLPDRFLQQYLYSADSFDEPSVPQLAVQQSPTNTQLLSNFIFTAGPSLPTSPPSEERQDLVIENNLLQFLEQSPSTSMEQRDAPGTETSPKRRKRNLSPDAPHYRGLTDSHAPALRDPVYAARRRTLELTWSPGLEPENFAPPFGEPQLGPVIPTGQPVYPNLVVSEAVEKALMDIVYRDLDRDPTVPSRTEPTKYLTAHSFSDMLYLKIGAFNTTANVRLSPLTFEWDSNGVVFPLRGRGPVWNENSCAADCVIMAGLLLDAGCTRIDRSNNRTAEFTDNEKSFIEITNVPWDTFDEKMSMRVRDEFLQRFIDSQLHLRMGKPLPPWAVWSQVTKNFAQFRYHHIERVTPCQCEKSQPFINSHQGSCILPGYRKGDDKGVSAATLIERCFYSRKSFPCKRCGHPLGVTGERKIGQLPLRLVMTFDQKTRLRNHTQHLKFRYIDYEDKKQVAHYRWLGGVYNNEEHARVYWTDAKRGEDTGGDIMMYDSQLTQGALFGGIPAFKAEDRVPLEWVNHRSIPLLFYERVLDPSRELLATAHNSIYDMGNILGRNQNVLEEHVPWAPSTPRQQHEPWDRVLSTTGERFTDYNPSWTLGSSNLPVPNPDSASKANVDPAPIDPTAIDEPNLDPSSYSNDVPPNFDLSAFIEPSLTGEESAHEISEDIPKDHMFGSMLDAPDWLSQLAELWPSGPPAQEGALEFPDLPTWDLPRGNKRRIKSDITMPDADEYTPKDRSKDRLETLKATIMVSQCTDPKQRSECIEIQDRQGLKRILRRVEDQWWTAKKRNRKHTLAQDLEAKQQRQERKIKKDEIRRARKKGEAETKAETNLSKTFKPTIPANPQPPTPVLPFTPVPLAPQIPVPLIADRTIKVRRISATEHVGGRKRRDAHGEDKTIEEAKEVAERVGAADQAKAQRPALGDKREADKEPLRSESVEMKKKRKLNVEDKRQRKGKIKGKDDDPAWKPGDQTDSEADC